MVDRALVARKIGAIRDAVSRIREVLPEDAARFAADRTVREVVILNLLVGLQETLSLAAHWVADAGWEVPTSYRAIFLLLADHGVLPSELATRLAAAAGLRNLVARQYGVLDPARAYLAATQVEDLLEFCRRLSSLMDAR